MWVGPDRPHECASLDAELELSQVRAGEVVRQVGGRKAERAVSVETHHPQYQIRLGIAQNRTMSSAGTGLWPDPIHSASRSSGMSPR
jgi:hypothetical protein